jgi:hypothetical protein
METATQTEAWMEAATRTESDGGGDSADRGGWRRRPGRRRMDVATRMEAQTVKEAATRTEEATATEVVTQTETPRWKVGAETQGQLIGPDWAAKPPTPRLVAASYGSPPPVVMNRERTR